MDYNKQKCLYFDKILTLIKNNNPINHVFIGNFLDEFDLETKEDKIDFLKSLIHYLIELEKDGYISGKGSVVGGNLTIKPKGIAVLHEGGFIKKFKEEDKVKRRRERLENLQITELEKRVEELEKQLNEQSQFFRSSTKRNRIQQWIIPLSFVISILALLVAYCK